MWGIEDQKKIVQNFKKDKDIYKFLELVSLVHEEVAGNLKHKKILNLKEDLKFIEDTMEIVKPKKSKTEKVIKENLSFDENIFYSLEGISLGLKEYINNKPKDEIIEKLKESDLKELLEESQRLLVRAKTQQDFEDSKRHFSKAACLMISGVNVSNGFISQIPKDDDRIILWTESIIQTIEHSRDYPITLPSDFQSTINSIWKNLKKHQVDMDLASYENTKEKNKKINIWVKKFIKEFLKNKTEIEKARSVLAPMYSDYINSLSNPKIKEKTAIITARSFFGPSKILWSEIKNIDSDVLNGKIQEYNKKFSKNVETIKEDYLTIWKICLEKKRLLKKQRIVVLIDSKKGDIVGSYA